MTPHVLKFHVGQIIEHSKFAYRGVIYDVDAQFSGAPQWYDEVAISRPPKDAPWYYVLVDGCDVTTYVAERHIQEAGDHGAIRHPLLDNYFSHFSQGHYTLLATQ